MASFDYRNQCQRARLGKRRVDEDDVILHLDGEAVMSAAREVEDTVGQLVRGRLWTGGGGGALRTLSGTVMSTG